LRLAIWRTVFVWLGAAGVVFGIWLFATVREPRRGCLDHRLKADTPSFWVTMQYLWSQRSAVHVVMATSVTALWGWGLMWWTPTYLIRTYSLSAGQAGAITAPMHLYGGIAASLLTGLAVSFSGAIGYVGLLVPHVMRMIFGSDHRILIPTSAFGGAIVLVIADTVARTVVAPSELPVGAMTALAGAPLFIYLLRRKFA